MTHTSIDTNMVPARFDHRHMVAIEERSPSNRLVAFVLAFFLGMWGFHRFYVGRPLSGALYLLTGAFFGVGWVWDLFMLAVGRFKDGEGRVLGPPRYAPRAQLVGATPEPDLQRHIEDAKKKAEEEYYLEEAMKDPLEEKFAALEEQYKGTDGNVW